MVHLLRRVVACPIPEVRDKLGRQLILSMLARGDSVNDDIIAAVSDDSFADILNTSGTDIVRSEVQFVTIIDAKAALEHWDRDPDSDTDFPEYYKVCYRASLTAAAYPRPHQHTSNVIVERSLSGSEAC